jgi:hypothetical protein
MPTIPRIFEQRTSLGEPKAKKLATRFHELIEAQSSTIAHVSVNCYFNSITPCTIGGTLDDPAFIVDRLGSCPWNSHMSTFQANSFGNRLARVIGEKDKTVAVVKHSLRWQDPNRTKVNCRKQIGDTNRC